MKRLVCFLLYYGFAQWLPASYQPVVGRFGKLMRCILAKGMLSRCGKNVNVEPRAYFHSGKQISLGDNSGIGLRAFLSGKVTIGKNVMMGPDVMVFTSNHNYKRLDIPMNEQGHSEEKPVVIEDDVWIGARVIILPGVRIAEGVIVGAGSVVTKSIEAFSIVGGNPARVIGSRKKEQQTHTLRKNLKVQTV